MDEKPVISKLRILTIVFSKSWGGLEMVACNVARELNDLGHEVAIVSAANSPISKYCSDHNTSHIAMSPLIKYCDFITAWRLARIMEEKQIDIIHVYISKDLSTIGLAKKIAGRGKVVFSQHMDSHYPKKDIFHRWVFGKVDMITTATKAVRQHVLDHTRMSHSKVTCIYNGVNLEKFNPHVASINRKDYMIPKNANIVGIVGRLDRLKRQELLVNAAPKILKIYPDTFFLIIGEESRSKTGTGYKQELINLITGKNLNDTFRLIDFVPDVQRLLGLFDVAVLTTPKETFGMVLIEAMAMKIPVVGTNAGGVPEIIDNTINGLLFEPDDVEDLSEKIIALLTDNTVRDTMGNEGFIKVQEQFDLKKKISEYERMFYTLLEPDFH